MRRKDKGARRKDRRKGCISSFASIILSNQLNETLLEQAYESIKKLVEDFSVLDRQIDQAASKLYGLEEETKVVKEK